MKTLILGGARSGKSAVAEARLVDEPAVDYVATGASPSVEDLEWAARVEAHRARRPSHWRTVETLDLVAVLATAAAAPALIECVSTWLAATMDDVEFWTGSPTAATELRRRTDGLVEAWITSARPVIAVSSEVGLSVVPSTAAGRSYRDELGRLNVRLAAAADEVLFVVAGLVQVLK
jgi:adenosyl cobinamide kinase/adenosyl cobinamide phosphate guanylyltransferase